MLNVPFIMLLFLAYSQTNLVLHLYQHISDKEKAVTWVYLKKQNRDFTFMCTFLRGTYEMIVLVIEGHMRIM
jgi:hypothetical protein